jgi:hypothetical protein
MRRTDLLTLAALNGDDPLTPDAVGRRAGLRFARRRRARAALERLVRRDLVARRAGGAYAITPGGARAGASAFAAQVLGGVQVGGGQAYGASRWAGLGTSDDRSVLGPRFTVEAASDRLDALVELAEHGRAGERSLALQAIGALRSPDAVEPLARILEREPDETLRVDAARALAATGVPAAAPPLRAALSTGTSVQREAVAEALGLLGDAASRDPLTALLAFPSAPVRAAAADALERLGDPAAAPALAARLGDDDGKVRRRVRRALVRVGAPEAPRLLLHNRGRMLVGRLLDAESARAALRHDARRPVGQPPPVSRFWANVVRASARWLALAAATLAVDVVLVGASPVAAAAFALPVAAILGTLVTVGREELSRDTLDEIHARLEPWPEGARPATGVRIFVTRLVSRQSRPAAVAAAALALDALVGAIGLAGLVAGGFVGLAVGGWWRLVAIRGYERSHATEVWTEALPDPLPRRRYFGRSG